jgi:hypothetical protein
MPSLPASQAEAFNALRLLFTAFPVERTNGSSAAATYMIAVEGYSLPAIKKAVMRLIRGEFDWFKGQFPPTTAQVSRACRYCEELLAPPRQLALPAPDHVRDDSPSALARRRAFIEQWRLSRTGRDEDADGNASDPNTSHPADSPDVPETHEKCSAHIERTPMKRSKSNG